MVSSCGPGVNGLAWHEDMGSNTDKYKWEFINWNICAYLKTTVSENIVWKSESQITLPGYAPYIFVSESSVRLAADNGSSINMNN